MTPERATCPVCGQGGAYKTELFPEHNVYRYTGCACDMYCISGDDQEHFLGDAAKREESRAKEISVLLRERRAQREAPPIPFLQFGSMVYPELEKTYSLRVTDLLARWPNTIPERIERCFCHLINARLGRMNAGQELEITSGDERDLLIFAKWGSEPEYFLQAMVDYKWVTRRDRLDEHEEPGIRICVTPKGWAHFDDLNRGQSDAKNPAFVAMWFGGKERREEMDRLYIEAIEPAIHAAGYHAARADTDEYNDAIMDKVIDDIRKAPFIVADLTENRNGVYYEAGFAKGCGIEVIYCCLRGTETHFDINGLFQLRYDNCAQLRVSLERRILGSVRRGPHKIDEVEAAETT